MADDVNENDVKETDELGDDATPLERQEAAANKIGVRFARDDRWEIWSWLSVGLAVATAVCVVVSYLGLGRWSMWAYVNALPYCGLATVLLSFWGLLRSFLRPPVLRRSRAIAFTLLLVVGWVGMTRPFTPTITTADWEGEALALPFEGEWMTLQGGESDANVLAKLPAYRWVYLWSPVEDGKVHTGEGTRVEDYHCWNRDILAPAAGEIVAYQNAYPDLEIERATNQDPRGNHVAIKIGEGEYVFVSNMMERSIEVRPGDVVEVGQPLGRCGRSGLSPYPAVAVHAQNSLEFPLAEGLPIRFDYVTDGERVEGGMPSGGEWGATEPKGTRVAKP